MEMVVLPLKALNFLLDCSSTLPISDRSVLNAPRLLVPPVMVDTNESIAWLTFCACVCSASICSHTALTLAASPSFLPCSEPSVPCNAA